MWRRASSKEGSGAVEGLRAQMWAESRPLLTAVQLSQPLGGLIQTGLWGRRHHCSQTVCPTCSITHALLPTSACPLWSHGLDSCPPIRRGSSQQLSIAPRPRTARVVEGQMLVMGKKCTHASVLNSLQMGSQGGVDPVKPLPRCPLTTKELRFQRK